MILEKFIRKNFNAEAWLKLFVIECRRLEIRKYKFPEILRLFLKGSALK
ncbi:hypothetical protein PUN28_020815 [Cardiocondyla obscurior]|uniref:Uncharacterized protein n=1 Tax=Cardiocondyla obscurior TaxID=286306 RepID=A0AAW2EB64_9HYME